MKRLLYFAITSLALLTPLAALAAPGFVTVNLNLRAGPDIDYPVVDVLPPGAPVDIQGCLGGYAWCDVIVDGNRGWVSGQFVQYVYENRRVYVYDYGARVGIPIVAFALGAYWDSYYRARPWYHDRDRWVVSVHGNRPYYGGPRYRAEMGGRVPVNHPIGRPGEPGHFNPQEHHVEGHQPPANREQPKHDDKHDDHGHEH